MMHSIGAEMFNASLISFCDEAINKKGDRRIRVSAKQIRTSPYNNIGWIQSRQNSSTDNSSAVTPKGNGFLISPSLVLTSSHNFVLQDDQLGEVTEFQPLSFSTLQPGVDGLVQKVHNIKRVKINSQFLRLSKAIALAKKNLYYRERDINIRTRYVQKILSLERQLIRHDFALLQLEQPIERPEYFELRTDLPQKCVLAVTGYVHHYDTQYQLFTHSDKFSKIVDGEIYYDIDTKGGQSGSPAYLQTESDQAVQVVGIHKAYDPQKRLNFATMLTESVIAVLKQWASQMDASFGRTNQNANPIEFINNCIDDLREKGDQLRNQAQFDGALSYYQRALDIAEKANRGKESIEWAQTLKNIGVVYSNQNKLQQALDHYGRAVAIHEKIGKESISWADTLNKIALVYRNQGKLKQELEYYCRTVVIHEKVKKESIEWANTLYNIGYVHYNQKKLKQALQYYVRSLTVHEKIGKESIDSADTLTNIGVVHQNQDKPKQALEYYSRALTIHEKIGKESIGWANTLYNIGVVYGNQNKLKQELEYYGRALVIHEKIEKESIEWADTLNNIGVVYEKQGLREKGRQFFWRSQKVKGSIK